MKRELEGGWFQWIAMPLPALLTIQSGINQLRYATLKGIMAAKKKEIRQVPPPQGLQPSQQIVALSLPSKSKQTQMIGGSPARRRRSWSAGCARKRGRCDPGHRRTAGRQAQSRHLGGDRRRPALAGGMPVKVVVLGPAGGVAAGARRRRRRRGPGRR